VAIQHILVQHSIPRDNGLIEDTSVNVWHFLYDTTGDLNTDALLGGEISDRLNQAYSSIDNLLSSRNNNPPHIKCYRQSDPAPRVPFWEQDQPNLTYGTGLLPSECAVVLSYHSAFTSGDVKARRRGRLYFGPLTDGIVGAGVGDAELTSGANDQFRDVGTLMLSLNSGDGLVWAQYSPTEDTLLPVVAGWVDNAFDTQRRRGARATVRLPF
jgi:hypothetical protein